MSSPPAADRVPAHTDEEALDRFLGFLRQSLRTVSQTAQWVLLPPRAGVQTLVTEPEKLRIKTNDPAVSWYLRSTMQFTLGEHPDFRPERKVFTESYAHTLANNVDARPEFCSWQWDPTAHPHAHVHVGHKNPDFGNFGKYHLPTARITFEQIVSFIFRDLDGLPNRSIGRSDAARMETALDTLEGIHARVQKYGRGRR